MTDKYFRIRLCNQLCFPLYLCSKEMTRLYRPFLEELDLTYTQYVVMMFFWEKKSATEKELSRTLTIDPSTLTPLIRTLERKGFIERTVNPEDKRSRIFSVTKKGEKLADRAVEVPKKIGSCLGLSLEEAAQLKQLTEKVLLNIERKLENGSY